MGALVTLADRLLILGDHLAARDGVLDADIRHQLRDTSVQSPQTVTQAFTQYADRLPSPDHCKTNNRDTKSLNSIVEATKRAFAAIMYARWDASVEDCCLLQFDEY